MELILVSGKIGVGKDYVVKNILHPLMQEKKTMFLSFADHFKIECIVKDDLSYEEVFHNKTDKSRASLQKRGTEEGRDVFGKGIWVNILKQWIRIHGERGIERIIIMDGRFINEVEAIKEMGGLIIRINSNSRNHKKLEEESKGNKYTYKKLKNHISEIELDDYDRFDYIIDNGVNKNVILQCRDIVKEIDSQINYDNIFFCDLDNTICHCDKYYQLQSKTLIETLSAFVNKNEIMDELSFNNEFNIAYSEIEGNYHEKVFELENFAMSLVTIVKKLRKFLTINDDDFYKIKILAYQLGMEVYNYNYEPIKHSLETIKKLEEYGKVVIVTQGDRKEQIKKICYLGLQDLDRHITLDKSKTTFIDLKNKYKANNYYMIGDNLKRDILSAIDGGIETTYWITSNDDNVVISNGIIFKVKSLHEAYEIIKSEFEDEIN